MSDGNYTLPHVSVNELVNILNRFDSEEYMFITERTLPVYYLPILSDPTEEDSDGDGLNDNDDEKPLVNYTNNLNECINKLKSMECYIVEYWNSIDSNRTDLTLCCMDLIRMIKYNGFRWNMTVGKPEGVDSEEKIKEYINSQDASIMQYFESMNNHIIYDVYGNEVDFIHLIATLRAQYNNYLPSKIMIDEDLSGWLGDLQSLIYDLKKETYGKDKNLNETAAILITNENTNFSMPDMIADIDAKNMYYLYNTNIALSQIVEEYYKNYSSQRYNLFIDKSGGIDSLKKKGKKIHLTRNWN